MISLEAGRVRFDGVLLNPSSHLYAWVGCRGRETKEKIQAEQALLGMSEAPSLLAGCVRESRELLLSHPGLIRRPILGRARWGHRVFVRQCHGSGSRPFCSLALVSVVSGQGSSRDMGSIGCVCVQCRLSALRRRRCQPAFVILWTCRATEPLFPAVV